MRTNARRIRSTLLATIVVGLIAAVSAPLAIAAPTDFDPTFGGTGLLRERFGVLDWGNATDVLVQPDGKILVAGKSYDANNQNQLVARFNSDGTRDTSFGGGTGYVLTDYSALGDDLVFDMALMPDGRIVTVGAADWDDDDDMTVTRYLSNGTLDDSFSGDGKLREEADPGTADFDWANCVAVMPDGKIVVAGTAYRNTDDDVWIRRFNENGNHDVTFNSGNPIIRHLNANVSTSDDSVRGLVVRADGKVRIAANYETSASTNNVALLGFDEFGETDTSFGTGVTGTQLFGTLASSALATDLIELPSEKLALLFTDNSSAQTATGIALWHKEGTALDGDWGTTGRIIISRAPKSLRPSAFVRLGDGSFLIGGYVFNGTANDNNFFAKVTSGGTLDTAFGDAGVFEYDSGVDTEGINDVAVQADGKFLGVGSASHPLVLSSSVQLIRMIGNYVAPPPPLPPDVALTANIKSPSKSKLKASKLKSISGTAAGTGLVKVQLAIPRVDPRLLKKSKRCLFVTGSKGKTKKYNAVKKKCSPTKYLTAKGTTNWSYKIKLKPGKYKLFLVGVGDAGRKGKTTTKTLTLTK